MRLSLKFIGMLLREQRRLSASVPKQDGFVRLEESFANQIDHPRRRAPDVNRIKQQTSQLANNRIASRSRSVTIEKKSNGANGMSDMEGKVTRVGVSKPGGERVSISQL
jgi:hypothetical protein